MMNDLVSTDWLFRHLSESGLTVVDCTWLLPGSGRDARAEYRQRHIPGARFLDLDEVADTRSLLPHMLPSAEQFGGKMGSLGIGREDRIVVYDDSPLHTAARGWFMLRHFGARDVAILDGGFGKWLAEGRPVESGEPSPRPASFDADQAPDEIVTMAAIRSGMATPLLDARSRSRFEGREAEPRPGVVPGHVPGSRNLPFGDLYREDGTFRSADELRAAFAAAGIAPDRPFVASCGSGVTACSLLFAAHLLGSRQARLYDGSWAEWGADPDVAKATGPT